MEDTNLETSDSVFVVLCVRVCAGPLGLTIPGQGVCLETEAELLYSSNRDAQTGPALPGSAAGWHHRDLQSQRV